MTAIKRLAKKNRSYFDAIKVKKQLKILPTRFFNWVDHDELNPDLEPVIKLPSYFLGLDDLPYGMTADVWGFLSIQYSFDYGYSIYEESFSNALMTDLEKEYSDLLFESLSCQKVLRKCRAFYRFSPPQNYVADYVL